MRKKITMAMLTTCILALSGCSGQSQGTPTQPASAVESEATAEDSSAADSDAADSDAAADSEADSAKDAAADSTHKNTKAGNKATLKAKDECGTGDKYECVEDEAHAIYVDGETATYDNVSVDKTGDADGDKADFYGTNAAVYAENGADLTITNSYIHSNGAHANAVFSYGEDTKVNISDSYIETESNNSGGIMVTGGGTLNAENLVVDTKGGSSAAIRSDRGGGTMTVTGGEYKSYGSGSPAIYSTADITVNDADLYSDISQAVVVEGKNSVTLNNVKAVGKNTKKNSDKSDRYQAVMIYQSMSGDASEGKGVFTMNGGSLESMNEGMFYVTNTVAEINLDNVDLIQATDDLLRIEKAGWGNDGSNGGQVTVNANNQTLKGVITVDSISNLNLIMTGSSTFEGSIDNSGEVYVELDDNAVWTLTADTAITSLTCDADAIDLNGYKLMVDGTEYKEGNASEGKAIEIKATENGGNHHEMNGEKPDGDHGHGDSEHGGRPEMNGKKPDGEHGSGKPGDRPEMNGKSDSDSDSKSGNRPEMSGKHGDKPDGKPGEKPDKKPDSDSTDSTDSTDETSGKI